MEPPPFSVWMRTLLVGAVLVFMAPFGACRRAGDVPAQAFAPSTPTAEQTSPDRGSAADGTDPSGEEATADAEAPKREALVSLESTPRLVEREREQAEDQGPPPVAESDERPESAEPQTPEREAEQPEEMAIASEPDLSAEEEPAAEPRLPPPLVDDPESLQRLHPAYPVWIDPQRKYVLVVGRICQRRAPLELFACMRGSKEHESVVVVDSKAYVVHAGLLAVGAEPGSPVRFVPEFRPASGTEIDVTVVWEDESGRRREARAQDWVRDVAGIYSMFEGVVANQFDEELNLDDQSAAWKHMEYPWVFAGSQFLKDERTGQQYYQADGEGDLICVSNFPSAVLDVPIRSSDSNAALLFEAYTERIPPLGTPVTLILTPKLKTAASDVDRPE